MHPLQFWRFRLHFGQTMPPVRSRSVFAVSHHLDGFLCTYVAGLLRPATSLRFNAFPPGRLGTRRFSGAFSFPALLMPFEGSSSSIAVSHHCDRCPLVVRLSASLTVSSQPVSTVTRGHQHLQGQRSFPTSQGRFPVPPCGSWYPSASASSPSSGVSSRIRSRCGYATRLRVVLSVHRRLPRPHLHEAAPFGSSRPAPLSPVKNAACATYWTNTGVRARRVRQSWADASPGSRSALSRVWRYRGTSASPLIARKLHATSIHPVARLYRSA